MPGSALAVAFHDYEPEADDFLRQVLDGLGHPQKEISCKFFYDERGSALFAEICQLDEYYLTRTEMGLLQPHAGDIASFIGTRPVIVEFGSGSGDKAHVLLDALMEPTAYIAIDISKDHLLRASGELARSYPGLEVIAICADYTASIELPTPRSGPKARRLGVFFGSTIGNFSPVQATGFLRGAAKALGPGGAMLVGVDLKKDPAILESAYNDRQGITAAFNLNLLARINRELDADFDLRSFEHRAFYDIDHGRIEMHLVSLKGQTVRVGSQAFGFEQGETIHTENSQKYSAEEFRKTALAAGFDSRAVWTDPDELFSLHYLAVR